MTFAVPPSGPDSPQPPHPYTETHPSKVQSSVQMTRSGQIIEGLSADAYHGDTVLSRPSLSASLAHILCTSSPRHAWASHPKLNPHFVRVDEERFDVGTVCHALLLERRDVSDVVHIVDAADWRTKAAQEQRDAARAAGLIPLLTHQAEQVVQMLAAVRPQLDAFACEPGLLVDGKPEQTIVWEEDGGVVCRARIDWLHDDFSAIDDLKTAARTADPAVWTRTMLSIGGDVQTRFYQRGVRAVTGVEPQFRFVVVETAAPFAVSVVSLAPSLAALADAKIEFALRLWRGCLERDEWPAYPTEVVSVEAPGWAESQWWEREAVAEEWASRRSVA